MKYLTIDASTESTNLALAEDGKIIGESTLSVLDFACLIPLWNQLLQAVSWEWSDVDFIGVVRGPGLTDRIETALSIAYKLARNLNIPVIGISSLDVLAWSAGRRQEEIIALWEGEHPHWYLAGYVWDENGEIPICLTAPQVVESGFLLEKLFALNKSLLITGKMRPNSREYLQEKLGTRVRVAMDYPCRLPGYYIVQAVWQQWRKFGPEDNVTPLYFPEKADNSKNNEKAGRKQTAEELSGSTDAAIYPANIRCMQEEDLKQVMKIEMLSFPAPWSPLAIVSELRYNEDARYFCLDLNGKVIGYLGLWLISDGGYITRVAIAPDYRGKGWGKYFLRQTVNHMLKQGMKQLYLEVRSSNKAACNFYQNLGFVQTGIIKGYYSDPSEEAIQMSVNVDSLKN